MSEEKKRAKALIQRIWSNRKRKEIMDILSYPNPPHYKRCYLGGFLQYGVRLSVDEILKICDAYAKWSDYDRDKTAYHLSHIRKESKAQQAIRTFHRDREEERSSSSFSSPSNELPDDAKRWIDYAYICGFVAGSMKVEGKLG